MTTPTNLVKHSGQVFTPDFLVCHILDTADYVGTPHILRRHVIDNSCGDGAFLCEIVARYCTAFLSQSNDLSLLRSELETYVHGIELDAEAHGNCLTNLSLVAEKYGVGSVVWDVKNANALAIDSYDGRMDYVVGNPPYVRVHNLEENYQSVKRHLFAQDGMTDLYLVFYELGFNMLAPGGRLCYITPSSWLTSVAATNMRHYIRHHRNLKALVDLGHYQPFENAITYTMIALFVRDEQFDRVAYYNYEGDTHLSTLVDFISYDDMNVGDCFYVATTDELQLLGKLKTDFVDNYCTVKNGFATLADKIFILGVTFSEMTIPIVKASTGKWQRGFYPYDKKGKPFTKQEIFSHPDIAEYLYKNKNDLLKGKTEEECPEWYLYGRTQALKDVYTHKYAINTVVKDVTSIKITPVPEGAGLYSGLYVTTSLPQHELESIVKSTHFIDYLRMLKKYKSGGYYTFNARDLEQYINYRATEKKHSSSSSISPKQKVSKPDRNTSTTISTTAHR